VLATLLALSFTGATVAIALLGMGKRKTALAVLGLATVIMVVSFFVEP